MIDVILPCLDEAAALPSVLSRLPDGYRAIVVDNGSSDGSARIAADLGAWVVSERRPGGSVRHARQVWQRRTHRSCVSVTATAASISPSCRSSRGPFWPPKPTWCWVLGDHTRHAAMTCPRGSPTAPWHARLRSPGVPADRPGSDAGGPTCGPGFAGYPGSAFRLATGDGAARRTPAVGALARSRCPIARGSAAPRSPGRLRGSATAVIDMRRACSHNDGPDLSVVDRRDGRSMSSRGAAGCRACALSCSPRNAVAGRCKTRLSPFYSPVQAAALAEAALLDTLDTVQALLTAERGLRSCCSASMASLATGCPQASSGCPSPPEPTTNASPGRYNRQQPSAILPTAPSWLAWTHLR